MPTKIKAVLAAIAAVATATLTLLSSLNIVHWSAAQTTLVSAEALAVIGFVTALIAHLWPGTKREPVAFAATLTAVISATLALGTGFGWWNLTASQIAAVVSFVSSIVGVGSALIARQTVTATRTP